MTPRDTISLIIALMLTLAAGFGSGWFLRSCNQKPANTEIMYRDTGSVTIIYDTVKIETWYPKYITKLDSVKTWDTLFQEYSTPYRAEYDSLLRVKSSIEVLNADSSINIKQDFVTEIQTNINFRHPERTVMFYQTVRTPPLRVFPVTIYMPADEHWYNTWWFKCITHGAAFYAGSQTK
jgi:hypothetical protein